MGFTSGNHTRFSQQRTLSGFLQTYRKRNHCEIVSEPPPQQRPRLQGEKLHQSLIPNGGKVSILPSSLQLLCFPQEEKKHIQQESGIPGNRLGTLTSGREYRKVRGVEQLEGHSHKIWATKTLRLNWKTLKCSPSPHFTTIPKGIQYNNSGLQLNEVQTFSVEDCQESPNSRRENL